MIKPKYKNTKTNINGINFDSIKEAKRYQDLFWKEKQGLICNLERQKKFEICPKIPNVKNSRAKHYICDFYYFDKRLNKYVIEDVKGKYTASLPLFKLKWQLMMYLYPEYEYVIYD